jgi:hypothetical protein
VQKEKMSKEQVTHDNFFADLEKLAEEIEKEKEKQRNKE